MNPLNYLYIAVAWVITQIHAGLSTFLSPNSGLVWLLTIVVLVVLMRLILVPLFIKQMHATRKMSALAPQLQELRKKYKNDKQTLNEETMRLYRENGVNPLGGCLPLVAQLPMFFALFSVLRAISTWKPGQDLPYHLTEKVILSAQHADIFGATISDKFLFSSTTPTHAKVVILIAVIMSVTTTYLTVRQSTKRGMTPQMTPDNPMAQSQKYMQYIVPLFALSGLYWQFGLVLYWVTTNVWTLGQQYVLFKRYPAPVLAGASGGTAAAAANGAKPKPAGGPAKPASGKPAPGKPAAAKPAQGRAKPAAGQARPAAGQSKPAAGGAKPSGSQAKPAGPSQAKPVGQRKPATGQAGDGAAPAAATNGSGLLRRLGRGRQETEEQAPAPEVKVVRQQRTRQSRSKRSGKR